MAGGPTFLYIFVKFGLNFLDFNTIPQTYLVLQQVFFQFFPKKSSFVGLVFFYFLCLGMVAIKMAEEISPTDQENIFLKPK